MLTAVETDRISQIKQTLFALQKLGEPPVPRITTSYYENNRLVWCIAEFEHRSDVAGPNSGCQGKITKKILIGERGVKTVQCSKCKKELEISLVFLQFQLAVWPY